MTRDDDPRRLSPRRPSVARLAAVYGDVQLATLVKEAPAGDGWTYELKFDGYRILALKSGRATALLSRRHQDWTEEFSSIATAITHLEARACVLDGEVCALDESGASSFQRLQNRRGKATRLVYFVFDCLMGEGRALPLRRQGGDGVYGETS